jgi:hypothetical protein
MPLSQDDSSENATRSQLVQVLLRDVLRRHGIPLSWVESQLLMVASRSRGTGMYVRLIMKHWDDRLATHAFALQNTLLADIARFEPRAFDWLHGVSWQLDVDASCPHTALPQKAYWQEPTKPATPAAAPAPAPAAAAVSAPAPMAAPVAAVAPPAIPLLEQEALQDLERLFLIRDQEIGRQIADGITPADYEKTKPTPL